MQESTLWTLKHAPRSLGESAGNDEAREELRKWALQWAAGKPQKPLLLAGPTGCGKTACGRALAAEMKWTVIETGASDLRDKQRVKRLYGLGSESAGLFGEKRLLLFDEVDVAFDKGELPELQSLLKQAAQPILFIANDAWDPKLAPLRALCKLVVFRAVNSASVKKVLKEIAAKEGVAADVGAVAANSRGDLRSAIIDLQAGTMGERERKHNVFNAVGKIFKTTSYREAMQAGDESEVDFGLLSRWLEENIPAEYEEAADVAKAFDALSRADVFRSRKARRQHHELYKYERALTLAGVALAKKSKYSKFTRYSFPSYVKMLATSRAVRQAMQSLASRASNKMHCSRADAKLALAFLSKCLGLADYLQLSEEEAGALKLFG